MMQLVPWVSITLGLLITLTLAVGGFGVEPSLKSGDISVVARDMAFRLEAHSQANPPIHLSLGKRVTLTLRNDEPGVEHELRVPSLGLQTRVLASGEEDRIEFIPSKEGKFQYYCELHPEMMWGTLIISGESQ